MTSFLWQSHPGLASQADAGWAAANQCDIKKLSSFFVSLILLRMRLAPKACHGGMKREVWIRPVFIENNILLVRGLTWVPNECFVHYMNLHRTWITCQQKNLGNEQSYTLNCTWRATAQCKEVLLNKATMKSSWQYFMVQLKQFIRQPFDSAFCLLYDRFLISDGPYVFFKFQFDVSPVSSWIPESYSS